MSTQESSKVKIITHSTFTYETTDGREFEDKDEALEWQEALDMLEDIVMLDSKHNPTNDVEQTYYVWIKTDEQVKTFNEIQDYYGIVSMIKKPGFYTYDEDYDTYANLESEMQKLQEQIDTLKRKDKNDSL